MTKQPFSNCDLPRQFLGKEGHATVPRTRDADEAARRRDLAPGTLRAEKQQRGLEIASMILRELQPGEDLAFATRMLAMAGLNASWYTFAQNAPDVMRRRLFLPKLADHESGWRQTPEVLRGDSIANLGVTAAAAAVVTREQSRGISTIRTTHGFGRQIGNVSLQLAALGDGERIIAGDTFDVQEQVRFTALQAIEDARESVYEIGAYASFTQLADPDSSYGIYWRRHAPDAAFEAYEQAIAS